MSHNMHYVKLEECAERLKSLSSGTRSVTNTPSLYATQERVDSRMGATVRCAGASRPLAPTSGRWPPPQPGTVNTASAPPSGWLPSGS